MDKITWKIDADGSRVTAEMQRMLQMARTTSTGVVQNYAKVDVAHGNLLKSSQSVSRAAGYAAQDLLRGAGALDVFSNSATFLAAALKLPLGPLLALVTAAIGANKIREIRTEFAALNKEADALADKKLVDLKTEELDKIRADAERIKKDLEANRSGFKGLVNSVAKGRGAGFDSDPVARRADAVRDALSPDAAWRAARPLVLQFQQEMALKYLEQRMKDIPKEVDAIKEARIKADALGKDTAAFKGSVQLSLSEIAKEGHRPSHYFDNTRKPMADVAREAIRQEELARKAMLREDYTGAVKHQSRADELKAGIPGLKDSEKISTFKSALDTSERLKAIEKHTSDMFRGR